MSRMVTDCSKETLEYLLSTTAIRQRCAKIAAFADGNKTHFKINREKLNSTAEFVVKTTKQNYPDLNVPIHSRFRHFEAGKFNRISALLTQLQMFSGRDQARTLIDLVIVSVLLDAGAGNDWSYFDKETNQTFTRSEGLGVASFNMFKNGEFSSDPANPFRVDAKGLADLTEQKLATGFQVSDKNPLIGVAGRCHLLQKLGQSLARKKNYFDGAILRPGNLIDYFVAHSKDDKLSATVILNSVLMSLEMVWPPRMNLLGLNIGDIWHHPLLGEAGTSEALIPFHKLSQWLSYSLFEAVQVAGIQVIEGDKLTGLAEYRNGGLILDSGLVTLRNPELLQIEHTQDSPLVVEWRALTVVFIEEIWVKSLEILGLKPHEMPLAKILEGGTWFAGRALAKENRSDGRPPLTLKTDGTLF